MILSLDPGQKPGIVILTPAGVLVAATHRLNVAMGWATALPYALAVSEEQWLVPDSDASPRTLFSLARRAGFQLAQFRADRYMFLPPKVWRGTTCADKTVVQNRIAGTLSPTERRLFRGIPKSRHGDVLDAIGIGRAALGAAGCSRKYDFVLHV